MKKFNFNNCKIIALNETMLDRNKNLHKLSRYIDNLFVDTDSFETNLIHFMDNLFYKTDFKTKNPIKKFIIKRSIIKLLFVYFSNTKYIFKSLNENNQEVFYFAKTTLVEKIYKMYNLSNIRTDLLNKTQMSLRQTKKLDNTLSYIESYIGSKELIRFVIEALSCLVFDRTRKNEIKKEKFIKMFNYRDYNTRKSNYPSDFRYWLLENVSLTNNISE